MAADRLVDVGEAGRLLHDTLCGPRAEMSALFLTREDILARVTVRFARAALLRRIMPTHWSKLVEDGSEGFGEHDLSVFSAFAFVDANDTALRVDVLPA